jgi:hypothetical protein
MRDHLAKAELSLEELEGIAAGDPSAWTLLASAARDVYNFFAPHSSGTAGTARPGPQHGPTHLF